MPDTRTNLLPVERQRIFNRNYVMRVGVVVTLAATALFGAAGLLLLPSYVYLSSAMSQKQSQLSGIESALTSSDETALSARLAALTADTNALLALQKSPAVVGLIAKALALPRPGIVLTGISYEPAAAGAAATLGLAGTAATRESLRSYQIALQSAPFSRGADLPVSAYAKDSAIPFSITVTLAP